MVIDTVLQFIIILKVPSNHFKDVYNKLTFIFIQQNIVNINQQNMASFWMSELGFTANQHKDVIIISSISFKMMNSFHLKGNISALYIFPSL